MKPDTGQAPAHKDEAPGMQAERSEGQGTTNSADSAATAENLQGDASDDKAFANLRATLGLNHGVCLYRYGDGSFLASKWNLSRPLADLHAVAIFARQFTGAM